VISLPSRATGFTDLVKERLALAASKAVVPGLVPGTQASYDIAMR
jgi:hypothetical protein